MTAKGLSERRSLRVIGMSASALRYQPRPDCNSALRDRIVTLAQLHAEMITTL
jgi:putative transposase